MEVNLASTSGSFREVELGEIEIVETGDMLLDLRPIREQWSEIELGTVTLQLK
jgi:hypothetical protein